MLSHSSDNSGLSVKDLLTLPICNTCNFCVRFKILELGVDETDYCKINRLNSNDLEVHITKNNIPKKKIIFPSDSSNLVCLTK